MNRYCENIVCFIKRLNLHKKSFFIIPKRIRSSFLNKGCISSVIGSLCSIEQSDEQVTTCGEIFKMISITKHELHLQYCKISNNCKTQKVKIESEGQYNVGYCLRYGRGTNRDIDKGIFS